MAMLKNESLKTEVRTVVNQCGKTKASIARDIGVTPQMIQKILNRDYELGRWVDVLDACGYDVEVRIKKRKE